jgi:hypothetical protein
LRKRQTFDKMNRERAVRERRARKQEKREQRKLAAQGELSGEAQGEQVSEESTLPSTTVGGDEQTA